MGRTHNMSTQRQSPVLSCHLIQMLIRRRYYLQCVFFLYCNGNWHFHTWYTVVVSHTTDADVSIQCIRGGLMSMQRMWIMRHVFQSNQCRVKWGDNIWKNGVLPPVEFQNQWQGALKPFLRLMDTRHITNLSPICTFMRFSDPVLENDSLLNLFSS